LYLTISSNSYNQSLAAVKSALFKFKKFDIPYQRPVDYYAEMIKSDAHMSKVKARLVASQKKIKAVEEYKQHQQNLKFGKQARAEREQEQARLKRNTLNAISDLRKSSAGEISDEMVERAISSKSSSSSKKTVNSLSKYKKQKRSVRPGKSFRSRSRK
jgi:rRNA-processing protein EBP2